MSERRELARVGDLIDLVLGQVANIGVAPVVRLRQRWADVAGEWAQRSTPVAIKEGVVTLEVASGLDASMLRYAEANLLSAVQEALGDEIEIRRIAVRVRSAAQGRK